MRYQYRRLICSRHGKVDGIIAMVKGLTEWLNGMTDD
jgi:hypothetical protein